MSSQSQIVTGPSSRKLTRSSSLDFLRRKAETIRICRSFRGCKDILPVLDDGGFGQSRSVNQLSGVRFMQWNLPYASLTASRSPTSEPYHSPFGQGPETPGYLIVASPEAAPSPDASRLDLSPATELVQQSVLTERSMLFLGGRQQELLSRLTGSDRRFGLL